MSLRSAKEIYLYGGHVTTKYADRVFRLDYDNKRLIDQIVTEKTDNNYSNIMLDSKPVKDVELAKRLRSVKSILKTKPYNRYTSKKVSTKYKSYLDLAIRNFVKLYVSKFDDYSSLIKT